jgi:hypothetical protein
MKDFCDKLLFELDQKLNAVIEVSENDIKLAEEAMKIIVLYIDELKKYVIANDFKNETEEIYFFKERKPQFISKFLYYNNIYKIEINKPQGDKGVMIKYYKKEQSKIKSYFDLNADFYRYYRSGNGVLDHKYFLRGELDFKLNLDSYYLESDRRFTTLLDSKVANSMSNDLILVYLKEKIQCASESILIAMNQNKMDLAPLTWTLSKSDLVELIYGLNGQMAFNNGKVDIKDIAKYLEKVFNVELGDVYGIFTEIKKRKGSKTKFIDAMDKSINDRIDQQDEK